MLDVFGVYDDFEIAKEEKGFLEEENRGYEVILKRKDIKDLIEYTVKYELAEERG